MLENGYIRLHRSLTAWRWYKEPKVLTLWLHLLLTANYEPRDFVDQTIGRGQLATSLASLSDQTGLTAQEVRTALTKLKKTGEISTWSNRHMTIITIENYGKYQSDEQPTTNEPLTDQQQTVNEPPTNQQHSINNNGKKLKKAKKDKKSIGEILSALKLPESEALRSALDDWAAYKTERGDTYTDIGLQKLVTQVEHTAEKHGERAVCKRIDQAIGGGWQGMNLEKLDEKPQEQYLRKGRQETGGQEPTGELQAWEKDWLTEIKARRNLREECV